MDIINLEFNDSIMFDVNNESVKLTLLRNKENQDEYALGVDAPRAVSINREEIYFRKNRSKQLNKKSS